MFQTPVREILEAYEPILSLSESKINHIGKSVPIPYFKPEIIIELCRCVIQVFQTKETLVEECTPLYILGDIHGNLYDLLRILIYIRPPPTSRILFLGDYVDRGEFSIEVITLLFALQCAYPNNITLLRGNHEFPHINKVYGFYEESIKYTGNDSIWREVNTAFQWMPIASVISNKIFCVHGGLSPDLISPQQLNGLKRPMATYDQIVSDVLWSDPFLTDKDYIRSQRGSGVQFGPSAVFKFLDDTNLDYIFRAHQCVPLGVSKFADNLLYTVFSSSNYEDAGSNRAGLLFVNLRNEIQAFSLPPNSIVKRSDTLFVNNKITCKGGVYSSFSNNGQAQKKCIALSIKHAELTIPNKLQTTLPVLIQRRAFKNYGRCQSYEVLPQMKIFSRTKAQKAMLSDS